MNPVKLSCTLELSYREILLLLILAGFTGLGTFFVLQPGPRVTQTPIVQQEAVQPLTATCSDAGLPVAPLGCTWALDCNN